MPNKKRITLRDIAKEAGVSHSTVSRALHNHPRIPEKTRQWVQHTAARMGYAPDPMLSALASYRLAHQKKPVQAELAWINFFEHPDELRKYNVFDQYWEGASSMAKQLGYHIEEFRWADLSLKRMDAIFKARGIRGIILSPSSYAEGYLSAALDAFPWKDYATVRFGQSALLPDINFISSAQVSNTITAFERTTQKGYKRVGFIGKHMRKFLFSAGFLWAQQEVPFHRRLPPLLYTDPISPEQFQERMAQWLQETKPDAIICATPRVPKMLKHLGYRIPDDLGVCTLSIHDTSINAGIDQKPFEIGRTAIRSLITQLHEKMNDIPPAPMEALVEGRWVDGSMLPPKPPFPPIISRPSN